MIREAYRRDDNRRGQTDLSYDKMETLSQFGDRFHDGVRKREGSKKTHKF